MNIDSKYYHGTSSIFLNSIKETGLGGINPNFEYRNLDVLRFLYKEAENTLLDNSDYLKIRTTTQAMAQQGMVDLIQSNGEKQRCFFRHDGIYIALSIMRAIVYANQNKYGSEIVCRCEILYYLLKEKNKDIKIPDDINLFRIDKLSEIQHEPIIIEVSNVNDYDLRKEDGKTAKEALDFLRNTFPYISTEDRFEFEQHCNFELLKPIPVENLKFYKLSTSGIPGSKDFDYDLIEM
ncbi:hypothetical protein [Labilibaculum euxinus]